MSLFGEHDYGIIALAHIYILVRAFRVIRTITDRSRVRLGVERTGLVGGLGLVGQRRLLGLVRVKILSIRIILVHYFLFFSDDECY